MTRCYRTGEHRSLPYGKRKTLKPRSRSDRDKIMGGPVFRSWPRKPCFAKAVQARRWRDGGWSRLEMQELIHPRWTSEKVRQDRKWLKQYGFRRKLWNAANLTRIRREVANRRKKL